MWLSGVGPDTQQAQRRTSVLPAQDSNIWPSKAFSFSTLRTSGNLRVIYFYNILIYVNYFKKILFIFVFLKPKEDGGLCMKDLRPHNTYLTVKLIHRLHSATDSACTVWVREHTNLATLEGQDTYKAHTEIIYPSIRLSVPQQLEMVATLTFGMMPGMTRGSCNQTTSPLLSLYAKTD